MVLDSLLPPRFAFSPSKLLTLSMGLKSVIRFSLSVLYPSLSLPPPLLNLTLLTPLLSPSTYVAGPSEKWRRQR